MPSSKNKQGDRPSRLPVSVSSQITLLTDFGTADHFVGAVKGVILSINPAATIVDITHQVPPHDIDAAAYTLLACYQTFSAGTIHLGVVDPGVGSARRPIVVQAGGQLFVGPDNGLFSHVLDREPDYKVFHITSMQFFRNPVSQTFHGRDIFAPVAAELSKGLPPETLGEQIFDPVRLPSLRPEITETGTEGRRKIKGRIIHIDRFGNCVTNIDRSVLPESDEQRVSLVVRGKRIEALQASYAETSSKKRLFAIWGSNEFLEISAKNRSAAKILDAECGDSVVLKFA